MTTLLSAIVKRDLLPVKRFILKIINRLGYVLMRDGAINALRQQLSDSQHLLTECRGQLAKCIGEKHDLSMKVGRAENVVQAYRRAEKRLQSEVDKSRTQLASHDTSGRISALETEKARLKQRIFDLETYLKETRGGATPYL